ncbi:MAG: hypothetical protein AAF654_08120 [Myxococcota bacterium]
MFKVITVVCSIALVILIALVQIESQAANPSLLNPDEQWVDANLLRVNVNGRWEEFPMMPLSRQMCQSNQSIYMRYCN